jgi:predicted RNA-binding Zn-ribbon protein involved in translation (DUF1610 family)
MAEKDVILAALGSDIAVAGLILVFAGFLMTKADSFEGSRSARQSRHHEGILISMKKKKPPRNVKLNPLLFRCPYCGEDNHSTTPMDTIFIARRRCSHCGEEILIKDGVTRKSSPERS